MVGPSRLRMDEEMYDDLRMEEICDDWGHELEPGIWSIHAELCVEESDGEST